MAKMSPSEKKLSKQINDASRRSEGKKLIAKSKRMRRGSEARMKAYRKGVSATGG